MAHVICMPWLHTDFGDFICSGCTIKIFDPLNKVRHTLLEPSIIKSDFTYSFKLSMDQYNLVQTSGNHSVEVRCIKMDGQHFFEQTWPDKCKISINDLEVRNIQPLPYNHSLKKRRDEKLTIPNIKFGTNLINIKFENVKDGKNTGFDANPEYVFMVALVQKLSVDELAKEIIANNTLSEADSKKVIQDKFLDNKDLKISEVKADLSCKMSLVPIEYPTRGKHCSHLNSVSLKCFLKSMDTNKSKKWVCPVCKKPAFELIIDGYLESLAKQAESMKPQIFTQVIFLKNG